MKLHLNGGWTDTVITVIYRVEEGRETGRKGKVRREGKECEPAMRLKERGR